MQTETTVEDQVLNSLNNLEVRRHKTDAAFRSITELEAIASREKTERLRAARMASPTKQ